MEQSANLEAFQALPSTDQVRFLLRLAWELTVATRDYYSPGTELLEDPVSVREINEIQHRVTAHALAVLSGDQRRYPDEVVLDIVLKDTHERNGLRQRVCRAWTEAHRFICSAAVATPKEID